MLALQICKVYNFQYSVGYVIVRAGYVAQDKAFFQRKLIAIFLITSRKHTLWILLRSTSLMNTHNICFFFI